MRGKSAHFICREKVHRAGAIEYGYVLAIGTHTVHVHTIITCRRNAELIIFYLVDFQCALYLLLTLQIIKWINAPILLLFAFHLSPFTFSLKIWNLFESECGSFIIYIYIINFVGFGDFTLDSLTSVKPMTFLLLHKCIFRTLYYYISITYPVSLYRYSIRKCVIRILIQMMNAKIEEICF